MSKLWRPLTKEELPDLSSGDLVVLRQNYLINPDRLPVIYVEAQCIEKFKREATFLLKGSDTPISISLTEVGLIYDNGWRMTGKERSKLEPGDPVLIYEDSGECRHARFMTCVSPYSAKVIFEGETEPYFGPAD